MHIHIHTYTGELLAIKEVSLTDDSGTAQRKEAMEQLEHEVSVCTVKYQMNQTVVECKIVSVMLQELGS